MDRGVLGCTAGAIVGFISVGCNVAAAAESSASNERGFYVGGSVNRVEQQVYSGADPLITLRRGWSSGSGSGFFVPMQLDQISVDDDADEGWNVTLGYEVNKYLAAEVSYYDFGQASVTLDYSSVVRQPAPDFYYQRYDIESFGLGVSLLGTLPLTSSLDIFARGGVLFLDQDIEVSGDARPPTTSSTFRSVPFSSSQRTGDEIWMAGAGVQWAFAPRWATRLEYQLTGDVEREAVDRIPENRAKKVEQVSLSVLFDF